MNKWDRRFLDHCNHIAQWSRDPRTKVGALLVKGKNKEQIPGYNGFPAGVEDTAERYADRKLKNQIVIHAELNAILTAKRDLKGYTLYSSLRPCINCTVAIIQSEIARVVYPKLTKQQLEKHKDRLEEWELAKSLLLEAGVDVTEFGNCFDKQEQGEIQERVQGSWSRRWGIK